MENKRMFFEVDADSIDIKQMLQKDFLELSMRVISDANPNVNGSWFTLDSMKKSKASFANKPILGYFENGDFVSHDGQWNYDSETEMSYWDTLGKKGERILGLIRESDPVEIVEGKDGLNWIELKCCLWVNYGYKQVKRLLKDAKKAKKEGGLAKNVSVEVDITDYEKLPNGVLQINEFNLIGVTILGSRNGVKVEPGIENAGLSVIDIMGTEVFESQKKAIRLAYEKIDNPKTIKEDVSKMENENQTLENEATATEPVKTVENFSENNDTPAASQAEDSNTSEPQATQTFESQEADNNTEAEQESEAQESASTNENGEGAEGNVENGQFESNAEGGEAQQVCPSCACDTVYDLAYLLTSMSSFTTSLAYTCSYYAERGNAAISATLDRIKRQMAEDVAVVGGLAKDASEELMNSILSFEKDIQEDTLSTLYKKYEEVKAENEKFSEQIREIETAKFLEEAKNLLELSGFDKEYTDKMFESCKNGEVSNLKDLKDKLALKMFEDAISAHSKKEEEKPAEEPVEQAVFSAPVEKPDTTSVFEEDKTKNKKKTPWETLSEYTKK